MTPVQSPARRAIAALTTVAFLLAMNLRDAQARVQDKEDPAKAAAHFREGKKLYDLGKFNEAIAEWENGYEAKPDRAFLINLGHAHRELGNFEKAIFYYKRYLVGTAEDAPNRQLVIERIENMEKRLKDQQDAKERERLEKERLERERKKPDLTVPPPPPPQQQVPPPPPPPDETPIYGKWWFWTAIVVAAGAGVGVVLATRSNGVDPTKAPAGVDNVLDFRP